MAACLSASLGHAAIDNGATGNGELFLNVWDCTRSYTRDLDLSMDAFEAALAEAGPIALSWPADPLLEKFLAGVLDHRELRWNLVAVDTRGAFRVLATRGPSGFEMLLDNDTGRRLATAVQAKINSINLGLNGAGDNRDPADDAQSAIFRACESGYAGDERSFGSRLSGKLSFDSHGTVAQDQAATGLGLLRMDIRAIGTQPATWHDYADEGGPARAWLDGAFTLHLGVPATPAAAGETAARP